MEGRPLIVSPLRLPQPVFVSGPMTGIEGYNYPEFRRVAAWLREQGVLHVEDPSTNFGDDTSLPRRLYLEAAITQLIRCWSIVLLDGWTDSEGSRLEHSVALCLGMTVARMHEDGPYLVVWQGDLVDA